jgi:preprotein translocase SecE subunit
MAGPGQYLKDTRTELRHVAWPTRTQTIVYTILIFAISVGVALYLSFFDLLFTQGISRVAGAALVPSQTQQTATTSPIEISTTSAQ